MKIKILGKKSKKLYKKIERKIKKKDEGLKKVNYE